MTFEPQKVAFNSWKSWGQEAFYLVIRKWTNFLFLGCACLVLAYLERKISGVLLYMFPLVLSMGVITAYCADKSISVFDDCVSRSRSIWVRLFIVCSFTAITFVLSHSALVLSLLPESATQQIPDNYKRTEMAVIIGNIYYWILFYGLIVWAFIPLLAVEGISIRQAFKQSIKSIRLNLLLILWISILSAVISILATALSILLIIPTLAMIVSLMYVSYRHIWHHKAQNDPKVVTIRSEQAQTAEVLVEV